MSGIKLKKYCLALDLKDDPKIIDSYKNIKVNYLSLDSYYKDYSQLSFSERAKINFDHPDSIDFDLFYQQIL